jgi:hypothetical protein
MANKFFEDDTETPEFGCTVFFAFEYSGFYS